MEGVTFVLEDAPGWEWSPWEQRGQIFQNFPKFSWRFLPGIDVPLPRRWEEREMLLESFIPLPWKGAAFWISAVPTLELRFGCREGEASLKKNQKTPVLEKNSGLCGGKIPLQELKIQKNREFSMG